MGIKNFERETNEIYIECMAMMVAANLNATYKNFANESGWSYDQVFNSSFDELVLSDKEQKIMGELINKNLEEKYSLKVKSNEQENLFFEKVV